MLLLTKTEEEEEIGDDDDEAVSVHFYMRWDHECHQCKENLTLGGNSLTHIVD